MLFDATACSVCRVSQVGQPDQEELEVEIIELENELARLREAVRFIPQLAFLPLG